MKSILRNQNRSLGRGKNRRLSPEGDRAGRLSQRLWAWLMPTEGENRGSWELPRIFPLFLLLFGAGMILISLVGDQGLIAYWGMKAEAESLKVEIVELKGRLESLTTEIADLHTDPVYTEYLARKNLGLVRPNEVIIQLPPAPEPE